MLDFYKMTLMFNRKRKLATEELILVSPVWEGTTDHKPRLQ
jgi:hypothetical protein